MNARDYEGLYAIIPTPALPHANEFDAKNTVDLTETARLVENLIRDGASGLITTGTTGECATLSEADYRSFVTCVLDTVNKRIPVFVGATCLGSHHVAERLAFLSDAGATGTLLGPPMWQPVTKDMAVQFYADASAYRPDLSIMVYANTRQFRFVFTPEFWTEVSQKAPSVSSAKVSRCDNLLELNALTQGRITFLPNEMMLHDFYQRSPDTTRACWATAAAMGPKPALALMEAILSNDSAAIERLSAQIDHANAPILPIVSNIEHFATTNIQMEKTRINAAGYCNAGPIRAPYNHFSAKDTAAATEAGRRWAALRDSL